MLAVGVTRDDTLWMRSNSTSRMPARFSAVELMDQLFLIDAEAREENMDHAARHLLRREKVPPLLDQIREHILATSKTVLPCSKAGQACNYTLALWKKLTCFLDYPQLELSNNLAENSMRGVAAWEEKLDSHIGSQEAGLRIAAILYCRRELPAAQKDPPCASISLTFCPDWPTPSSSASASSHPRHGLQKHNPEYFSHPHRTVVNRVFG